MRMPWGVRQRARRSLRLASTVALTVLAGFLAGPAARAGVCDGLRGGPGDLDGDGVVQAADIDDADPTCFLPPGETTNLRAQPPDPVQPFAHVFVWDSVADPGSTGADITYDALRSGNPADFLNDPTALCLEPSGLDETFTDTAVPASGQGFFYFVRARNACSIGDLGQGQKQAVPIPRPALTCDCSVLCDDTDACTDDDCSNGVCVHRVIDPVVEALDGLAVCPGSDATFTARAAGNGNLSYQWFKNGQPVGINNPTLMLVQLGQGDNGAQITVEVTDGCSTVTSPPATLTVFQGAASCSGGLAGQEPVNRVEADRETVRNDRQTVRNGGEVYLHSGEFVYKRVDLAIPSVGFDLVWGLTYRSRAARGGRMGFQWTDSYDRRVEWETPANPVNLLLHDGSSARIDLYTPDGRGCWTAPGHFRQICPDPGPLGGFLLTTPSNSVWTLAPLDGSPAEGTLQQITDRNGNGMSFSYDAAGRLTTLTDTLSRNTTLAYDANDRVVSVTDFSGRVCSYSYYQAGEAGGEAGDLKSITSPAVTGTPTGNDFPQGKTTLFTYTEGAPLAELNHNLVSITDPLGQTFLRNVYSAAVSPADNRFDRMDRQIFFADAAGGGGGGRIAYAYVAQTPSAANNQAVSKTIVNDRAGNVSEHFHDAASRVVMVRRYTGRAPDAVTPTGENINRPVSPLRAGDPLFFERRLEYNGDSLVTRVVHPRGNEVQLTYDTLNQDVRLRGNLLTRLSLPGGLGGGQASITESWTYQTPFGTEHPTSSAAGSGIWTDSNIHDPGTAADGATCAAGNGAGKFKIEIQNCPVANASVESIAGWITETVQGKAWKRAPSGGGYGSWWGDGLARPSVSSVDDKHVPDWLMNRAHVKIKYIEQLRGSDMKHIPNVRMKHIPGGRKHDLGCGFPDVCKVPAPPPPLVPIPYPSAGGLDQWWGALEGGRRGPVFPKVEILTPGSGLRGKNIRKDISVIAARGKVFPKVDVYLARAASDHIIRKIEHKKSAHGRIRKVNKSDGLVNTRAAGLGGGTGSGMGTLSVTGRSAAAMARSFPSTYTDGRGSITSMTYDGNGNLVRIDLPPATQNGGLPPQQIVHQYAHDSLGRVTRYISPELREDAFSYHASGPQTGYLQERRVDDLNLALSTTFGYDAVGNVTSVTDPKGQTATAVRNALNQVVRIVERPPFLYEIDYYRDAADRLVRVDVRDDDLTTLPRPYLSTRYVYDSLSRMTRSVAEVDEVADECVVEDYEYTPNDDLTLVRLGPSVLGTRPNNVVRYETDERDFPYRLRLGEGSAEQSTHQYDYDANGNPTVRSQGLEDPAGPHLTTSTYDGYDRLATTTNAEGSVLTLSYDANSNEVSQRRDGEITEGVSGTNVRLAEQSSVYDEVNRLLREDISHFDTLTQQPIGDGLSSLQYGWNRESLLAVLEDDTSDVSSLAYDSASRPLQVTDPKGNTEVYAYDANSNLVSVTSTELPDVAGRPTEVYVDTFEHDALDRLTATEDSLNNRMEYEYDARGNPTRVTDALSNETRLIYDGLNRVVRSEEDLTDTGTGAGTAIDVVIDQTEYQEGGTLVARKINANGNETVYSYDALDRLTTVDLADGTQRSSTYDVHHDLVSSLDPNASLVTTTYDRLHRPVSVSVAPGQGVEGTTFESYLYDGLGRLVQGTDDDTVVTFEYDSLSGVTRETTQFEGLLRVTSGTFDGDGRLTSLTYPSGRVLTFSYDALDRLSQIVDGPVGAIVTYDYVGPGRVQRETLSNGVVTDSFYDGAGRMVRRTHTSGSGPGAVVVADHSFEWDAMYNKKKRNDLLPGGEFEEFGYDSVYRLVESLRGPVGGAATSTISYELDLSGNRETVTGGPDAGTYTRDAAIPPGDFQMDQYTLTPPGGRLHDENGNLTRLNSASQDERDNSFDVFDQMVSTRLALAGSPTVRYVYDVLGRRVARQEENGPVITTTERWNHSGGMYSTYSTQNGWRTAIEEEGTTATTTYVFGASNDIVCVETPSGTVYQHLDDLGSAVAGTDALGGVVERADYADYGDPSLTDATGASIPISSAINPFLFRGLRFDIETGFYYLGGGAYLDTRAGRTVSRVQAERADYTFSTGSNSFSFSRGNPWTDSINSFTRAAHDAAMNSIRNMK